jgi:RimJ/RimL family protein N-acetyltransferase
MPVAEVQLREVRADDLPIFFAHQLDPDALRMAGFPSRGREAFWAHWEKIMGMNGPVLKTILFQGEVAGNIVSWEQDGEWNIGYWIGKEYWHKGIASAALRQFLSGTRRRPLHAWVTSNNAASIRVLDKNGFKIAHKQTSTRPDEKPTDESLFILDAS